MSLQTPGWRGNRLPVVCAWPLLPPAGLISIVPLLMPVVLAPLLPRGARISTTILEVQRGLVRLAPLRLLDSPSKPPLLDRSLAVPLVPLSGAHSGEMATEGSASVACGNSYWALPAAQTYSSG